MSLPKRLISVAAAADANVVTGAGAIYGINLREVTAVAAAGTLTVYDNTSAAGAILAVIRVAANGNAPELRWPKGLRFNTGIHVAAAGADFVGSVQVGSSGALRALPFAGVDLLLNTGGINVDSILAAETAGAVAEWRLLDAVTVTGTEFAGASHAANETRFMRWETGLRVATGLQYDQLGGATSGAVYVY